MGLPSDLPRDGRGPRPSTKCWRVALGRSHFVVAGSAAVMPIALAALLNYMRPDLTAPLLDHPWGALVVSVIVFLDGLGPAVMLLGWWLVQRFVNQERRTLRRFLTFGVGSGAMLLFTLPAIFLVLFSPVAFVFMYGGDEAKGVALDPGSTDDPPDWNVEDLAKRGRQRAVRRADPQLPEVP